MLALFNLSLEHSYFANNLWQGATLEATSSTQAWLNRYQLSLHQQGNICSLYSTSSSSNIALLDYLQYSQGIAGFEFWLLQPLESFVTFTDLPINWLGQFQFDTSNSQKSTKENGMVLLSTSTCETVFKNQAIAKIRFNLSDLINTQQYLIRFEARLTQWVYHLVQRGQTRLHEPQLIDKQDKVIFTTPTHYQSEQGDKVWLSNSGDVSLPLQQVPTPRFKLVDTQQLDKTGEHTINRTVINTLPAPRSDQIQLEKEESLQRVQSHMYVYF